MECEKINGMIMRALSVRQPWANKIADGEKTIEIRSRRTSFRGPVLILSSKRPSIPPCGCAVAVVDLVDCRPMDETHVVGSCCDRVYADHYAWILANPRRITPVPVKGALGLFSIDVSSLGLEIDDANEIELRLNAIERSLTPSLFPAER